MKRILISVLVLSIASILSASTYYCSPNGNGDGTSYQTSCSLKNGLNLLSAAGDTLYLLGGQYNLGNTKVSNKNGSASAYIVISGYPGETAILDFRTTPYGTRGLQIESSCTYVHVKDLTLRYSGKNNLYNAGSYCLFERLDIYGSSDTGCQMKGGGNNIIKNVDSHDNFDYEHVNGSGQADYGGNADGFADKQFTGAGNHYIGCRAWNNSDDGWDFYQRVSNSQTVIEDCICYQNGPAEYNMVNHPRYQTDKTWFDQINGTTVTSRYGEQVLVTLEHYPNMGNGNGFKLGGDYTSHNVLIHHCLAIANTVRGFDQNNNEGQMIVYNNTGYANGTNFGFYENSGVLTIRNNVSFPASADISARSKTTIANDHNTWNQSTGVTLGAADFQALDTTQVLLARKADGSRADSTLFRLAAGSDLIDAGIDVGLFFTGAAPDLGCFESDGVIRPHVSLTSGPSEQWVMAGDSIVPLVFKWSGTENIPTNTKPEGISAKVSNTDKTVTFSGFIDTEGIYTITVSTTGDSLNMTATAVIHVRPASCKRVAWVSLPGSASDNLMLEYLAKSDSIVLTELSATETNNDYSQYDIIVLSPAPQSSGAAYPGLKGYNKPMLVLKPWLFKSSVWNWGTAVNTSDLSVTVTNVSHPIFTNIPVENGSLQLFTSCNTNAVTAINGWNNASGQVEIATPASHSSYSTITEFPIGSSVGGTTFSEPLLMIGISEYSTANLTHSALRLVENAIYYLLGMDCPVGIQQIRELDNIKKYYIDNQLIIERNGIRYSVLGQRL